MSTASLTAAKCRTTESEFNFGARGGLIMTEGQYEKEEYLEQDEVEGGATLGLVFGQRRAVTANCRRWLPGSARRGSPDFTGLGRERRTFSLGAAAAAARRARQLNRARAALGGLLQLA